MSRPVISRYVAIGDSLSEGVSDGGRGDRTIGFAALLAGLLTQATPELQFTNLGLGGARIVDVLRMQTDRAIALEPQLLTVVVGANDVPVTSEAAFARDYQQTIAKLRAGISGLIVIANIPNFAHLLPAPFAPFRATIATRIAAFNRTIADAAAQHDALLVDLEHAPDPHDPRNVSSDGIHPNARGYRVMARAFVETLNKAGYDLLPPTLD